MADLNILRQKFKNLGIDYKKIDYKKFIELITIINKKNIRYEPGKPCVKIINNRKGNYEKFNV